ncbi:unnamed protein product [Cuscuta europaea]|uniref:Uncharacterized protein n=1 Tax=Cuscuta europaea TaxID=41803 RepID=A0A9P1E8A8_CUSEU|nr:unnamed protein product [Cuscuta europaea]
MVRRRRYSGDNRNGRTDGDDTVAAGRQLNALAARQLSGDRMATRRRLEGASLLFFVFIWISFFFKI